MELARKSKPIYCITVYNLFFFTDVGQYQHLILFVESEYRFILGIHHNGMKSGREYLMTLSYLNHFFDPAEDNAFHSTLVMAVRSFLPVHRRTMEPSGIMGDLRILFILPPVQLPQFIPAVKKRDSCIR